MSIEIETLVPPPPAGGALHATRPPAACDQHPGEPVVGFCASCLRERLAPLEAAASADSPRRKSTSSALKSIFSRSSGGVNGGGGGVQPSIPNSSLHSSSFRRPELRRCKSLSASRIPVASMACEPQRKSCDVRVRSTLWSLFHQDDRDRAAGHHPILPVSFSVSGEIVEECPNPGYSIPVEELEDSDEIMSASDEMDEDKEASAAAAAAEVKCMNDDIDIESQSKKPVPKDAKEIAGSFWLAASVFSNKLRNWRRKQKLKKKPPTVMPPEKTSSSWRLHDSRLELAIDAFGRRSCDIDPRFSLDAGRFSFDDPRYSWDEPRASWDGYLIGVNGGRTVLPRLPPMLAVAEDSSAPAVQRFDGLIPVEDDMVLPGGSSQTRSCYHDSSCRGSRGVERSNSTRKKSCEMKELKPTANANAKGSPMVSAELIQSYHGTKHERDSREWSSSSLRDECSESFNSGLRDQSKLPPAKKSRSWSKALSFFAFIHRRGGGGKSRGNGVERSFSETWPELGSNGYNDRICRSNSNIGARSSFDGNAGFGSMRNGLESNGHRKKKKKKKMEEAVLERFPSSRYSPSHFDNGLLRFYLPAMKGSRRRSKYSSPHSFTGIV